MTNRIAIMILCSFLFWNGPAYAWDNWRGIGAGCVPAAEDIQANNYVTGGHGVYFRGTSTGSIRLTCRIPSPEDTFHSFHMYYRDPDGMGTDYRIRASLKTAEAMTTSATTICTTDSSSNSATGYTLLTCNFSDFVPDDEYWYWFDVIIERTSTVANPEFLGLGIH